ncbi:MAG: redoxin domain-containing protein [Cyanobacteria bacterium HKST-UBA01]|nr:redoxin domain-containing protein [Cyanobacteria bacterium HKST-UBA01]
MPLRMDTPLPSLEGGTDWFNSAPITNDDLKGKPVLIHFWSISCHNCKESLPDINNWVDEFAPSGLKIISVHMPRSEADTNVEKVKEAVEEYKMKQPCVVDNWHEITDRFENKFVPAYYVFDSEHKLRHFQAGEKALKMVKPVIERVLGSKEAVSD